MATITLYAGKINQMPGLIQDVKLSVGSYKAELAALQKKSLSIRKDICNMDDVISSLQTSTQTQEEKLDSLETLSKNVEQFIDNVVRIDNEVADLVNQRKDEFFDKYTHLRPDCERSNWDKFKQSVGGWCKEHWKLFATIVIVAVAVVLLCTGVGGIFGAMALGALLGAGIGGVAGGTISALTGGSFFEGFENGAFSGAIAGIISGGMGSVLLSAGGTTALSGAQLFAISAISGAGSSLISDLGDIISGDDISFGQVLLNMGISGLLSGLFVSIGYGISKAIPSLKVNFGGKATPLENGPYIKNGKANGRPSPSAKAEFQFEQNVYNKSVGRNGILKDPNTNEVLPWKPGQPRQGVVDFGHKPGKSYNKVFQKYKNGKISLEQLKEFQLNPNNYRIEAFSANRSHVFEKSIFETTKGFPWSSGALNAWKEYTYEN